MKKKSWIRNNWKTLSILSISIFGGVLGAWLILCLIFWGKTHQMGYGRQAFLHLVLFMIISGIGLTLKLHTKNQLGTWQQNALSAAWPSAYLILGVVFYLGTIPTNKDPLPKTRLQTSLVRKNEENQTKLKNLAKKLQKSQKTLNQSKKVLAKSRKEKNDLKKKYLSFLIKVKDNLNWNVKRKTNLLNQGIESALIKVIQEKTALYEVAQESLGSSEVSDLSMKIRTLAKNQDLIIFIKKVLPDKNIASKIKLIGEWQELAKTIKKNFGKNTLAKQQTRLMVASNICQRFSKIAKVNVLDNPEKIKNFTVVKNKRIKALARQVKRLEGLLKKMEENRTDNSGDYGTFLSFNNEGQVIGEYHPNKPKEYKIIGKNGKLVIIVKKGEKEIAIPQEYWTYCPDSGRMVITKKTIPNYGEVTINQWLEFIISTPMFPSSISIDGKNYEIAKTAQNGYGYYLNDGNPLGRILYEKNNEGFRWYSPKLGAPSSLKNKQLHNSLRKIKVTIQYRGAKIAFN